jgi:hypothetical protein
MKRIPWTIILTLLAGFGLGLGYSWLISPLRVVDSEPLALRADFKDHYRSAIAAAYVASGNLPRAQARLALLRDSNPVSALNSQAQRMISSGEFSQADRLAALASALENGSSLATTPPTLTPTFPSTSIKPTLTLPSPTNEVVIEVTGTPSTTETQSVETQLVTANPTPHPTRTPIPTLSVPYVLIAQDTVCDTDFENGLLQVTVFASNRRQVPGAKIIIAWENGEEAFFTGLKPEIGNGYADFLMTPNVTYTVRLASGSDIVTGLVAPTCQTPSGEGFLGGIKLTFQQP